MARRQSIHGLSSKALDMMRISTDENQFSPGSPIVGTIAWQDLSEACDRIEVRLIWYTTGKGDRDVATVDQKVISSPETDGMANFKFIAPDRPYSFSGKLISLTWAIEAVEFPKLLAEKKEIFVSADGAEVQLYRSS